MGESTLTLGVFRKNALDQINSFLNIAITMKINYLSATLIDIQFYPSYEKTFKNIRTNYFFHLRIGLTDIGYKLRFTTPT